MQNLSIKHQTRLCQRLSALGIKQDLVHSLIDDFNRWNRSSGHEWTIKRMKAIKVAFFNHLAGNETKLGENWVASRSDGLPKGALGTVIRQAIVTNKPRLIQRALSTLMIYSDLVSDGVTKSQWKKFSTSVEQAKDNLVLDIVRTFLLGVKNHEYMDKSSTPFQSKLEPLSTEYSFENWNARTSSREPLMRTLEDGTGKTLPENFQELWNVFRHPLAYEFVEENLHKGPFEQPSPGPTIDLVSRGYIINNVQVGSIPESTPVGKIGFIQEPGYKLRAVANPHRGFQFLLDPLKKGLLDNLKRFTPDCTHNQDDGVRWAQQQLAAGRSISSVDLSDATNNFPLSLQIDMLNAIYPDNPGLVKLFEKVSTANWIVYDPEIDATRNMVWSKGQPLGLGPSFPAFAASHHLVMWGVIGNADQGNSFQQGVRDFLEVFCNRTEGIANKYIDKYRIVGDDIVMLSEYENHYKGCLTAIGIPVSEDKTITSSKLAEFASKVITPTEVYIQNKWAQVSDRSFLDLMRNLGPTAVGLLRPRQKQVISLLSQLPEWEGGLGWNPHGVPLGVRLGAYEEYINREIDDSELYQSKETLAKNKALIAFGDTYTYNAGISDIAQAILQTNAKNAFVGDSQPLLTEGKIDTILRISERRYKPSQVPSNPLDQKVTLTRVTGDPRGQTVLNYFENSKVRDVLSRAQSLLTAYADLLQHVPAREYVEERIIARIRNDRPLGVSDIQWVLEDCQREINDATDTMHNELDLDEGLSR